MNQISPASLSSSVVYLKGFYANSNLVLLGVTTGYKPRDK